MRTGGYPLLYFAGGAVMYLTPLIIGAFWGAPMIARELEAGTHRLAWNQSVARDRWLLAKLGIGGLAAMVFAGPGGADAHLVGRADRQGRRVPCRH